MFGLAFAHFVRLSPRVPFTQLVLVEKETQSLRLT